MILNIIIIKIYKILIMNHNKNNNIKLNFDKIQTYYHMKNNINSILSNIDNYKSNFDIQSIFNVKVHTMFDDGQLFKNYPEYNCKSAYINSLRIINNNYHIKYRNCGNPDKIIIDYNVENGQDIFISYVYEYNQIVDMFYMHKTLLYYKGDNDKNSKLYNYDKIKNKIYNKFDCNKKDINTFFEDIYNKYNNLKNHFEKEKIIFQYYLKILEINYVNIENIYT